MTENGDIFNYIADADNTNNIPALDLDKKGTETYSLTPPAVQAMISKLVLEAEKDPITRPKMEQFVHYYGGRLTSWKAKSAFMKEFIKDHKPFLDKTFGETSIDEFARFWETKLDQVAKQYVLPLDIKENMALQDSASYRSTLEGRDYPDFNTYFQYSKFYRGPRKQRGVPYMSYERWLEENK